METTIQKWGNSLAVRLPKQLARKLKLNEGSAVFIAEDAKHRIVIKRTPKGKASLASLISRIHRSNLHSEVEWNVPRGKEAW